MIDSAERAEIRAYVESIGADRYRVTSSGEVHIYGRAPNSTSVCWYLYAHTVAGALARIREGAA